MYAVFCCTFILFEHWPLLCPLTPDGWPVQAQEEQHNWCSPWLCSAHHQRSQWATEGTGDCNARWDTCAEEAALWGKSIRPPSTVNSNGRIHVRYMKLCVWLLCAIVDHERMVRGITTWGVWSMGLPHSPKTDRDRLIKDNLGRYCPKTFETAKGKNKRWCCQESNPGPLATSTLPLSHNIHQPQPLLLSLLLLCSEWLLIKLCVWLLCAIVGGCCGSVAEHWQLKVPLKQNFLFHIYVVCLPKSHYLTF